MERARRRCRQEWREITVRWRRTGLTAVEFARQEGLNPSTFAGWRSEFAREDKAQSPPLTLVPIRYPGLPSRPEPVEIVLPKGISIRVPDSADRQRTAELVGRLLEG